MRHFIYAALAVALIGAPAMALAQSAEQERGERPERGMRAPPGAWILEARDALGLTDAQVARIEEIRARHGERNRAAVEELRAIRGDHAREWTGARERTGERARELTPEQRAERRAEMRARMEAVRPQMRQIRENNRTAMTEMRAVLSEEQQTRLRELRAERRAEWRERANRQGEMRHAPGRRGPDSPRADRAPAQPR